MHNPLRFFVSVLLAGLAASSVSAFGATVEAINDDSSRVILKLTQVELAAVEDDQTVLLEVTARPTAFVVAGKLTKVNPVKKTVVVILEKSDLRFDKRQGVRFLSLFFNPLLSPVLTTYSQNHPYVRSSVEGGFGYVYEKKLERSGESRSKSVLTGTEVAAEGYFLISPRFFGGGLGFRRFDGTSKSGVNGSDEGADVTINQLRPGAWFEIEPTYVIGLRYDFSFYDQAFDDNGPSFSYSLGALNLGLTHYGADWEWNLAYQDEASFTAIDSTSVAGQTFTAESTLKTPALLDASFRDVQSPLFGWGFGLGYVFYERELKEGQELRSKPTVAELIRTRLNLEWRLDDGSKIDTVMSYSGGRASNRLFTDNVTNKVGLSLTYLQPVLESLMVGGTLAFEGGAITLADEEANATTGEIDQVAREVESVGASLLIFARTEFDLLAKGRKR